MLRLLGVLWNSEDRSNRKDQVYDSEKPEARPPIEQLCRNARKHSSERESQWITGTEAGKSIVLPLAGLLVRRTQYPDSWWYRCSRTQTKEAVQCIHDKGVRGKAGPEREQRKNCHAAHKYGLAPKHISSSAKKQEECPSCQTIVQWVR